VTGQAVDQRPHAEECAASPRHINETLTFGCRSMACLKTFCGNPTPKKRSSGLVSEQSRLPISIKGASVNASTKRHLPNSELLRVETKYKPFFHCS